MTERISFRKPVVTHPCAAVGCEEQIERRMFMCREHWSRVPAKAQAAVVAWSKRRNVALWRVAARRAVAYIAIKEERMTMDVATAWVKHARDACEWEL